MDTKQRMHSAKLYDSGAEELIREQQQYLELLYDFNQTRPSEQEKRGELLKRFFAEVGKDCYIEPPLHANWGCHVHMGDQVYANFNLTLVDDTDIRIGSHVMIGPNVTLAAGTHPILPDLRRRQIQYNVPIVIGENVWLGAGVIILPGISVGENSVIGAGSVVTKDIPSNVIAVGNPCRVLRQIGARDREYYYRDMRIDLDPNGSIL